MPTDAEREVMELRATHILEQRAKGVVVTLANMPTEADLRKLYDAQRPAKSRARKRKVDGTVADFYDLIDDSGGPDACHPWAGRYEWNHNGNQKHLPSRYKAPVFEMEDSDTKFVTRILVFLTYGVRLTGYKDDVTPICCDHTCCNVRHFAITPHGGGGVKRDRRSVPVAEWVEAHRA